ncbi:50S ribosomal protein L24 [Candidatus Roizmanbacteria bacterium]|nr:50S ribosomal protein L24 [Candidatus Roizmanbacteria bacterium]
MKIRKGDKVRVMAGKDKGREGVVEKVYKKSKKVLIQKINIYKKHIKKSEKMPQGGVVEVPRPIDVSKIMFICTKCGKATRIGYNVMKGKKLRICKKCESKV